MCFVSLQDFYFKNTLMLIFDYKRNYPVVGPIGVGVCMALTWFQIYTFTMCQVIKFQGMPDFLGFWIARIYIIYCSWFSLGSSNLSVTVWTSWSQLTPGSSWHLVNSGGFMWPWGNTRHHKMCPCHFTERDRGKGVWGPRTPVY